MYIQKSVLSVAFAFQSWNVTVNVLYIQYYITSEIGQLGLNYHSHHAFASESIACGCEA